MRYCVLLTISVMFSGLLASCGDTEYIDFYKVNGSEIKIISEGEVYKLPLNYFNLVEEDRFGNDTIYLENEIKTVNTGFIPVECTEVISSVNYGNYIIKRCLYKTAFEVFITSWIGSNERKMIPIHFEAEEIWLNSELVLEQPYVFEKINTEINELSPDVGETDVKEKYLLDFQIVAHNRYSKAQSDPFNCYYKITRLNKSEIFISPDNIVTTVAYDWHPGN